MLKQAENTVRIEGLLSEIDLRYGSFMKNGEPMNSIGGTIKIHVNQEINGTPTNLEVPTCLPSNELPKYSQLSSTIFNGDLLITKELSTSYTIV